ncbi:Holliday junction DNA helicase RuvA [Fructilactobacillus lindneri]|uniref:Holliday junction branch migration complex subunit RuvA n=1 Tax=Fructilactobacillus lindneri TaxID=53444 RepID=A0AB33BD86_9LACO|nr:Holliday junction branch migration protein RuvA [Fructilactobacillus lindneri]ANZ58334.1 Holliday junction ATP-dependent DNA helicase RuvA [Fructilactobacillus lindneri]ANZ59656.1 Holliday junction ATP-dependent DNA helicase RuvA [Fructilactobacillus lindneri]POG98560.1 Holliday junction DNA helicase RuvA [Fructilactobacillus lindneri]POH03948.1 Holliday junction DNA helicase RuvA [Fructilactobacillus lindneri]POH04809.1 Holliday junction DNA helicase RuvA [Fructilactobacillus lindneri]
MFEYLKGKITSITPKYIVVETNQIGYLVYVANPYHFETDRDEVKTVYIHQNVSDTDISLYGFATLEDKYLFEQLLNVSGIGAKSALAIMAGNDNSGLINAIRTENVSFLTKFPGIGKKTAQQIILDLKDKINKTMGNSLLESKEIKTETDNDKIIDALSALKALGFKEKAVDKIKPKLLEITSDYSTDQYISVGLKMLTK